MTIEKKLIKHDAELISKAKFPWELVKKVSGKVDSVESKSIARDHTPLSERRHGGTSPSYQTGYQTHLVLEMLPFTKDGFPRIITFRGFSPVVKNQQIIVGIFAGEEKRLLGYFDDKRVISRGKGGIAGCTYYTFFERSLQMNEEALYISILDNDGSSREIRRDYSVDYDSKFHEQK